MNETHPFSQTIFAKHNITVFRYYSRYCKYMDVIKSKWGNKDSTARLRETACSNFDAKYCLLIGVRSL